MKTKGKKQPFVYGILLMAVAIHAPGCIKAQQEEEKKEDVKKKTISL